jgi:hypothetical protein
MRKIPTVFVRDHEDRRYVTTEVNPGCEWVFAGEGVPTRKYDGTCVMLDIADFWWARREVKPGKQPPAHFRPVETDEVTGKTVGWEPIKQSPFAKFHAEALDRWTAPQLLEPGTYELIGPKVNGNPEGLSGHELVAHADAVTPGALHDPCVSDFTCVNDSIAPWLLVRYVGQQYGWEGIVWHHPDGRMAKLKAKDLRPVSGE